MHIRGKVQYSASYHYHWLRWFSRRKQRTDRQVHDKYAQTRRDHIIVQLSSKQICKAFGDAIIYIILLKFNGINIVCNTFLLLTWNVIWWSQHDVKTHIAPDLLTLCIPIPASIPTLASVYPNPNLSYQANISYLEMEQRNPICWLFSAKPFSYRNG